MADFEDIVEDRKLSWAQEQSALNAVGYRVNLLPVTIGLDPKAYVNPYSKGESLVKAQHIELHLPQIALLNKQGYDIQVYPLNEAYWYLVLDDLTTRGRASLLAAGHVPCLDLYVGADLYQIVLKINRDGLSVDAKRVVEHKLNQIYGLGIQPTNEQRPIYIAGLKNKKEGRLGYTVNILSCSRKVDDVATELMQEWEAKKAAKAEQATAAETIIVATPEPVLTPVVALDENAYVSRCFRHAYDRVVGICHTKGWPVNRNRVDLWSGIAMLQAGFSETQVKDGMLYGSPNVRVNYTKSPVKYVDKTAIKAAEEVSKRKVKIDFSVISEELSVISSS